MQNVKPSRKAHMCGGGKLHQVGQILELFLCATADPHPQHESLEGSLRQSRTSSVDSLLSIYFLTPLSFDFKTFIL